MHARWHVVAYICWWRKGDRNSATRKTEWMRAINKYNSLTHRVRRLYGTIAVDVWHAYKQKQQTKERKRTQHKKQSSIYRIQIAYSNRPTSSHPRSLSLSMPLIPFTALVIIVIHNFICTMWERTGGCASLWSSWNVLLLGAAYYPYRQFKTILMCFFYGVLLPIKKWLTFVVVFCPPK